MNDDQLAYLQSELEGLPPEEGLRWLAYNYQGKVAFSTSFGQEDQVITHFIFRQKLPIRVFTLDTGRLFAETYDLFQRTRMKYKQPIETYFPGSEDIEILLTEKGPYSFYDSVENRKECCFLRKVKPLKRALKDTTIWVTGLRAAQSDARQGLNKVQWDAGFSLFKYNPLIDWTYEHMLDFIDRENIPCNPLHKKGFISIGCAPCTRAIAPGEDLRAGRWWWEQSHKECGLHTAQATNLPQTQHTNKL
ncbi:MAG: phosphoadenylyl-sulfate reductase [Salibacteraceae bacterium]